MTFPTPAKPFPTLATAFLTLGNRFASLGQLLANRGKGVSDGGWLFCLKNRLLLEGRKRQWRWCFGESAGFDLIGNGLIADRMAMSRAHSFTITLANNRTEKEGLDLVLASSPDIYHPDKFGREEILRVLDLPSSFLKTFDAIRVPKAHTEKGRLTIASPQKIVLIELKATKKRLPHNPYGFFFGATENEFKLAERLGEQFQFAFTCLHPEFPSVKFLTLAQLRPLIRLQRTQYQINLLSKPHSLGK